LTLNRYKGGVASQKKFHVKVLDKEGTFMDGLASDNFGNVHCSYKHPTRPVESWFDRSYKIEDYFRLDREKYGKANLVLVGKNRIRQAYEIQNKIGGRIPLIMSKDAVLIVPNKREVAISASKILNLRPGAVEATGKYIPIPCLSCRGSKDLSFLRETDKCNVDKKITAEVILNEIRSFMFDYDKVFNYSHSMEYSFDRDKLLMRPGY
jgi:hypothetical protein